MAIVANQLVVRHYSRDSLVFLLFLWHNRDTTPVARPASKQPVLFLLLVLSHPVIARYRNIINRRIWSCHNKAKEFAVIGEEQSQRIKDRVDGRAHAKLILQLGEDDAPKLSSKNFWLAYWETMRDQSRNARFALGEPDPEPKLLAMKPMSDAEAREFAEQRLPFGKFEGLAVWRVLQDNPNYLDWLCGATDADKWKQNLIRFMQRPEQKQRLGDVIDTDT